MTRREADWVEAQVARCEAEYARRIASAESPPDTLTRLSWTYEIANTILQQPKPQRSLLERLGFGR